MEHQGQPSLNSSQSSLSKGILYSNLESEVLLWKGITTTIHRYGGLQFDFEKKEIGHIHGNGILDVLLNRKIKLQLIKNGLVEDHHVLKKSGWISFYIRSEEEVIMAKKLLKLACQCQKCDDDSGVQSRE